MLHPSEVAQAARHELGSPRPGSLEEENVLARIDELREEEMYAHTGRGRRRQRRRLAAHWSDRGSAIEGR